MHILFVTGVNTLMYSHLYSLLILIEKEGAREYSTKPSNCYCSIIVTVCHVCVSLLQARLATHRETN